VRLQDKGLRPEALSASGFGEYRPTSTNSTEDGRQHNRRIEVVVTTAAQNVDQTTVSNR